MTNVNIIHHSLFLMIDWGYQFFRGVLVLTYFIPRWSSDCVKAGIQSSHFCKQVSSKPISYSRWCWQHCQLHLCVPDRFHMCNLGSSWQRHLGKQTWKFSKSSLPLMQGPRGTIMLLSWKHVVYPSALFLWCLSGELMIIVTQTPGEQRLLMSCIQLQGLDSMPLFVCLRVCVRISVVRRSAVCGSTGTPHGRTRRLQTRLHLFWNWYRKWREPERKHHPARALSLCTAGKVNNTLSYYLTSSRTILGLPT